MLDLILKSIDTPDETSVFEKGKFEIVRVGGMTIGRGELGNRLGGHNMSARLQARLCEVEYVGMVVSACGGAKMDGSAIDLAPGNIFCIPPVARDSWVVGDQNYVSLHFWGADQYTK